MSLVYYIFGTYWCSYNTVWSGLCECYEHSTR